MQSSNQFIRGLGSTLSGLAVIALAWSTSVGAEEDTRVYRWKDQAGSSHYGDYVPPEAAGQGHTVLNQHGVPIESVAGELTSEEQAVRRQQAKVEADAAEVLRVAVIRDKVLLSTYYPSTKLKPCAIVVSNCSAVRSASRRSTSITCGEN